MDWLLNKLEDLKFQYAHHEEVHFRNNLNQAWLKLEKYYRLTDESPAYLAAIVLHPHLRWAFVVNTMWCIKTEWIEPGKEAVKALWEKQYKGLNILDEASTGSLTPPVIAATTSLK